MKQANLKRINEQYLSSIGLNLLIFPGARITTLRTLCIRESTCYTYVIKSIKITEF